jgi:hypothetical protein
VTEVLFSVLLFFDGNRHKIMAGGKTDEEK